METSTVVFLMAVGRLHDLMGNLVELGYPSVCHVAIIEKASTPNQRTVFGEISTIADIAKIEKIKAPAAVVVGEVRLTLIV